jgi:hypothetical protein
VAEDRRQGWEEEGLIRCLAGALEKWCLDTRGLFAASSALTTRRHQRQNERDRVAPLCTRLESSAVCCDADEEEEFQNESFVWMSLTLASKNHNDHSLTRSLTRAQRQRHLARASARASLPWQPPLPQHAPVPPLPQRPPHPSTPHHVEPPLW